MASTTRVTLTVYNSEGKVIKKLVDEEKDPGTYEIEFFPSHSSEGENLKEGRYYYCFEASEYKIVKEMQLLK